MGDLEYVYIQVNDHDSIFNQKQFNESYEYMYKSPFIYLNSRINSLIIHLIYIENYVNALNRVFYSQKFGV